MNFPSKVIEDAVNEFSKLPGVGKRTALRFVLHLMKQQKNDLTAFSNLLIKLKSELKNCSSCNNISDREVCDICNNPKRNKNLVCVVEDMRDVMAIESTGQFNGVYHVLGGIISPLDGIGPSDLNIEPLITKAGNNEITEVFLALSTTMEGDTTNFYLYKKLKDFNITLTTIARGISIGDELEYTDEITLGRSIINRTPYEKTLEQK